MLKTAYCKFKRNRLYLYWHTKLNACKKQCYMQRVGNLRAIFHMFCACMTQVFEKRSMTFKKRNAHTNQMARKRKRKCVRQLVSHERSRYERCIISHFSLSGRFCTIANRFVFFFLIRVWKLQIKSTTATEIPLINNQSMFA